MKIHARTLNVDTKGFNDVLDLTDRVSGVVREAGISNGTVTVFVPGSTAGITTLEYERGAIEDLKKAIERLVPSEAHYDHNERWGDGNGFAHVRAALLGPSLSVPVVEGDPALGTWQQVILVDFDNRPRRREILIHCVGE